VLLVSIGGVKLGIEFTGGTLVEVRYDDNDSAPEKSAVLERAQNIDARAEVRLAEANIFTIRMQTIGERTQETLAQDLSIEDAPPTIVRLSSIGPTLGAQLEARALLALVLLGAAILLFVAIAFSAVSKPISSWKYGLVTLIALAHDVIITIGFFALLGLVFGTEVDTLFVTALLVILGYSINDTIVVLDRVRDRLQENTTKKRKEPFDETVAVSLRQTIVRSINTSLSTLLALLALFFFGPAVTHDFSLALMVGVLVGAYSSIFIAAPLLVLFWKTQKNKKPILEAEKVTDDTHR
jgi:preprotein translocase subunit SecF